MGYSRLSAPTREPRAFPFSSISSHILLKTHKNKRDGTRPHAELWGQCGGRARVPACGALAATAACCCPLSVPCVALCCS